jgi:hypothetical protein
VRITDCSESPRESGVEEDVGKLTEAEWTELQRGPSALKELPSLFTPRMLSWSVLSERLGGSQQVLHETYCVLCTLAL